MSVATLNRRLDKLEETGGGDELFQFARHRAWIESLSIEELKQEVVNLKNGNPSEVNIDPAKVKITEQDIRRRDYFADMTVADLEREITAIQDRCSI